MPQYEFGMRNLDGLKNPWSSFARSLVSYHVNFIPFFSQSGHQDAVQHVDWNKKGTLIGQLVFSSSLFTRSLDVWLFALVSCSADMTIKLWETQEYNCVKTLTGHEHNVSSVMYIYCFPLTWTVPHALLSKQVQQQRPRVVFVQQR